MSELHWRKSTFSEDSGNNCVEIAATPEGIALRESDDPRQIATAHTPAFDALLTAIKTGRLPH